MICPDDADLITEYAERRRRFLNALICQIDHLYLNSLTEYNHILKQRNAYLKSVNDNKIDLKLIESFDKQILPLAEGIYKSRNECLNKLAPHLEKFYKKLTDSKETVSISYQSDLQNGSFQQDFSDNVNRDLFLRRTELGIHRDDFKFEMDGHPIKKFGSQGQQKSFIVSMKLAEFEIFKDELGITPVLLLDDIFDKLDDSRISNLVELVQGDEFGQIFITDARKNRLDSILKGFTTPASIYIIKENKVIEYH